MVTKKAAIGITVVVIILAFIAIAAIGGSSEKDPNARYNYEITFADTYNSSFSDLPQTPDEGKKFMILDIVIFNDDSKEVITTNPFIFEWHAVENGLRHTYLDDESLYPTPSSIEIVKGGHASMAYCWQVDKDTTVEDVTIGYEYPSYKGTVFVRDTTIAV